MNEPAAGILIELDDRGRASLARVGRHTRYLANVAPDGTIILTPAVVTTLAYLESLHPGIELKLAVGAEEAKRIGDTYDEDPSALARRARTRPKGIPEQILAVIRAAGPDGLPAKHIVQRVEGSRSTIFNTLANMRNLGQVQNPNGYYIIGPEIPAQD